MTVTIRLVAELDRRTLTNPGDLPDLASFAILAGNTVKGADWDVPAAVDPCRFAELIAAQLGEPFEAPDRVLFSHREDGSWFAFRIRRGGGTGRGRRSTQPAIVFRQTAVAA